MRIRITEEQLKAIIHEALCESKSIADDVLEITYNVMRAIRNEVKKNNNRDEIISGVFSIRLFDSTFTVRWTLYDATKGKVPPIGASIDFKDKTLIVDLVKDANGLNQNVLADSLQHELEHYYQKLKRPNEEIFNDKDGKLYDIVLMQLSKYDYKTIEHKVARCIYLMFNAEQDAYVNGLYGALINGTYRDFNRNYRRSDAIEQLNFLRNFYNETIDLNVEENENEVYIKALKPFNRDITWFLNYTDRAIRRFSRKIGRVKNKAYSELADNLTEERMMYSVKNYIKQKLQENGKNKNN